MSGGLCRPKDCEGCGQPYRPHVLKQKFCSMTCRWPKRTLEERLWDGVVRGEGCWERTSPYHPIKVDGRQEGAHRLSWRLANGAIPVGMMVLHHCDNPPCIRPDHLFLGTNTDNMQDAKAKGRLKIGEANARAILTVAAVRSIRERSAAGESAAALGVAFGVTRAAIWSVVTRQTWQAVP